MSLMLHAVNKNGRDAFAFNGDLVAPVIRASPGDTLKITYINDLPAKSTETTRDGARSPRRGTVDM